MKIKELVKEFTTIEKPSEFVYKFNKLATNLILNCSIVVYVIWSIIAFIRVIKSIVLYTLGYNANIIYNFAYFILIIIFGIIILVLIKYLLAVWLMFLDWMNESTNLFKKQNSIK
jgi:hypothetical protein